MQVKLNIPDNIYEKVKELAKTDLRTASQEIVYILGCHTGLIGYTPTQPNIYIPAPVTTIATSENPMGQPIITAQAQIQAPTPDISNMNGLELQEYARKLSAEAKTKITQEKQEAREEAKQLTPEEEQMKAQKQELQKQKLQEKRDKAIRDRAIELDLWNSENYNESVLLFNYYGEQYAISKGRGTSAEEFGGKPLEELYKMLQELKYYQDQEEMEDKRRDALPHDVDDWDYKSEDFDKDLEEQESYKIKAFESDPDYRRIREYYISHCYYHRLIMLLKYPHAFCKDYDFDNVDYEKEYKTMKNVFNRDKIDDDYITAIFYGDGEQYREKNKCISYSQELENERKELEEILKNRPKKSIIG